MELCCPVNQIMYLFESSKQSKRSILKELELSPTAYNEWKKGKSKPSLIAINKIANYFNVSTDYIFGRCDLNFSKFEDKNNIVKEKINSTIDNLVELSNSFSEKEKLKAEDLLCINNMFISLLQLKQCLN